MTLSDAASLLLELRECGVELEVVGDRLRFRPSEHVTPEVRQRLAAFKPAILALLHEEADAGDGGAPTAERCRSCRECDFVRPRAGGAWRCPRCRPYDLPAEEIEWWPRVQGPFASLDVSSCRAGAEAGTRPCTCCGSTSLWRLRSGGPWTCSRCHPAEPAAVIETVEAAP